MTAQLAFDLRLRDGSSFQNFYPAGNGEALDYLHRLLAEPPSDRDPVSLYLWGEHASGKTHLLEAACHAVRSRGAAAFYLPLGLAGIAPAALEELEHSFLICLDDVERVAGDAAWESALFARYELARAAGARLLVSATAAPMRAGFKMPELASRLGWGPVYQLHALGDADKVQAMQLRARNRGFEVSGEVARYILHRYPRDLAFIFDLLERIDAQSLASQRRVTIPFLRQLEASVPDA